MEDLSMHEKLILLANVKKECKKLMEEAVTKKFIHTDSSSVTSLCSAIECCIIYKLKKRAGGLLPAITNSDDVLSKIAKFCPAAESIQKISAKLYHQQEIKDKSIPFISFDRISDEKLNSPERKQLNGYTVTGFCTKYLWIRLALLEKVIIPIISALIDNAKEFYENNALLTDQVHAPSLVWLLDGPCSLDYSKMKTPETIWIDPSAGELVQRHRIYSLPAMSNSTKLPDQKRRRLFSVSAVEKQTALTGVPTLAREHVESLHQNAITTLLYGKNNVELSLTGFVSPIHGYLSLHKTLDSLLLKWTPNPMLQEVESAGEKSEFWDQATTVDLADVVYLHCHSAGENGGNIVLISQDGVQLSPLLFPTGGSLLSFLTCLEQGLSPNGRLDPPLFNKQNAMQTWSKFRKNVLTDKLVNAFQDLKTGSDVDTQDFVFRVVYSSSSKIDKSELRKLLYTQTTGETSRPWSKSRTQRKTLVPKMHTVNRLSRSKAIPSRIALNLACEKMKHQILSRAFNGWLSSYRHLKTVRTHLASLVLPWSADDVVPEHAEKGLTSERWKQMNSDGLRQHIQEIRQLVYYGGVEHSIRHEVWPYLLGHYMFTSDAYKVKEYEKTTQQNYTQVLEECKSIEQLLQEKEKDLLALNGFANGETFGRINAGSVNTHDSTNNDVSNETLDCTSQDVSINSTHSEGAESTNSSHDTEEHTPPNKEFSVIKTLLETKDNLREMVENASARGTTAWNNLTKKSKKKKNIKTDLKEFNGLPPTLTSARSFDLELECQSCGKKIIESRQNVADGKFHDNNIETVECFACKQERNCVTQYDAEVSPYKIGVSPTSVVYDHTEERDKDTDIVMINGEGTPLQKCLSLSSVGSSYADDILKDFALNIHRIDKDVLRCDRNHPYFAQESNLEKLRNIMMTYVWERLNIGYIQGMCDLCAPLLVIMDDEAKVYGCFLKMMNKMTHNFPHGEAMDMHLSNIGSLIQILDPELHEILEAHGDSTIFYFCYRWFLLDFKRELVYEDVFLAWETIWAASTISSEHFNLFVALAIIELYREIVIDNKMDFTDIIKFFNEMAEQHDVRAALNLARNIVRKLQDIMHPGEVDLLHVVEGYEKS